MNNKSDVKFMMRFSHEKEDSYKVKVASPSGDAIGDFTAPFTAREIEAFVTEIGSLPSDALAVKDITKEFGRQLYDQVFKDQVFGRLCASIERCEAEDLRLRIILDVTEAPELAVWPWEYLYDQSLNRFIGLSSNTTIVRYLQMPERVRSQTIRLPLRVLVMISNPRGYAQLDVEAEWAKLQYSLAGPCREGLVELKRIKATREELRDAASGVFHIFHFIGHGGFDQEQGKSYVILEGKNGEGDEYPGEGLGMQLHDVRPLRLVVLNSCEGASASLVQPFAGTAQAILQQGIPAVVAMQFSITDDAALTFAGRFYKALAGYYPVDVALAEARKEIFSKENYMEWATPVLYMRSEDGRIFSPAVVSRPENQSGGGPLEGHYKGMIDAILKGRMIPFLGPGVNRCRSGNELPNQGKYPPDDCEIAEHLAQSLKPEPVDTKELARVSQKVATMFSPQFLYTELHSVLGAAYEPLPVHKFLAAIPGLLSDKGYDPPHHQLIVTSNYDNSLEKAFEDAGEPFDLIFYRSEESGRGRFYKVFPDGGAKPIKPKEDEYALSWGSRTVILKINGAFDPHDANRDSYVITEDHYINYVTRDAVSNLLPGQLKKILQKGCFLFLGYRLRDWNLRVIFHRLWGDAAVPQSSWVIQPDSDPVDQRFWNKRNVIPMNIDLTDYIEEMKRRLLAIPAV